MAPLALTLALLAMSVATVAIEVVTMDMAKNSFDDQYLSCRASMTKKLPELQDSDFAKDKDFKKAWDAAWIKWQNQDSSPLSTDQAVALMAYTTNETGLYKRFNDAVSQAGSSSEEYQNNFHFKSLHFLLTQALQKLSSQQKCRNVFRGVGGIRFEAQKGTEIRFGRFTSTSQSQEEAQGFGRDTMFKVHTCHGADIQKFSKYPKQQEVLIPPFEIFEVVDNSTEGNTLIITLRSTRNSSNHECEWLRGGSLPRNAPHLGGLLLATVAMAVAIGTL